MNLFINKPLNRRRFKLLKGNKDRLVFRITNRSLIVQYILKGYIPSGDIIKNTWLFHKTLPGTVCNSQTIEKFLGQILPSIDLRDTILDLGTRHKQRGTKLNTIINLYTKFKDTHNE